MLGVQRHGDGTGAEGAPEVTELGIETRRRDLVAEGLALEAEAGRTEQRLRAEQKPPPRSVLRALGKMQKSGRRGRKAKARINRILMSKIPEAMVKR